MRSGLKDGTLTAEAWEEVRELLRLEGEDSAALVTYEEARRRLQEDEAWSPIAPRDYVLAHLGALNQIILDALMPDTPEDHAWSLAVAVPGAGEFICSNSPLTWSSVEPWDPRFRQDEPLTDSNLTVMFPVNKKLALITRPYDRGVKQRGFRYEAVAEVVAWVNTRTQFLSWGTVYSARKDYGLLLADNQIWRSIDYFRYMENLRRGAGV